MIIYSTHAERNFKIYIAVLTFCIIYTLYLSLLHGLIVQAANFWQVPAILWSSKSVATKMSLSMMITSR